MTIFFALLRGINVSGKNRIQMPVLKKEFTALGFANVETYIQSGNVIFENEGSDPEDLTRTIERRLADSFGIPVQVLLRDLETLQRIVHNNPFHSTPQDDPERIHLTFLSGTPRSPEPPLSAKQDDDEFFRKDREVYVHCPHGYGRTKFSNTFFERVMGVPATTRNWKTVNHLIEIGKKRVR